MQGFLHTVSCIVGPLTSSPVKHGHSLLWKSLSCGLTISVAAVIFRRTPDSRKEGCSSPTLKDRNRRAVRSPSAGTTSFCGGCCGTDGEKYLTHCQRAFPDCEPPGGRPRLSLIDEELPNNGSEGAFAPDRDKQSFLACWVVPDRDSRSRIFRDFVARGAGRRGIDSHLNRMDNVEAAR